MDDAQSPPPLTPTQTQQVQETIIGLDKEIPKKPKVRGSRLQNLLRRNLPYHRDQQIFQLMQWMILRFYNGLIIYF